jgi:hypothetical protein
VVVVRRAAIGVALLGLAACDPEIGSGIYFCGPERGCPPELRCDEVTATCVFPNQVNPFACATGANDYEPDDAPGEAGEVTAAAGCGAITINELGCVDEADDVDHLAFVTPATCDGELEVDVRYAVAFAPLVLELLDDGGDVIGTGTVCDELDEFGEARLCATAEVTPDQRVMIRVGAEDGGADCDGTCGYNRYRLSIF